MEKRERIAVIGAVLEHPTESQQVFNEVVSHFRLIVKGRMGVPFEGEGPGDGLSVISIIVQGDLDDINALTGKLGSIPGVTVKTAVSGALGQPRV